MRKRDINHEDETMEADFKGWRHRGHASQHTPEGVLRCETGMSRGKECVSAFNKSLSLTGKVFLSAFNKLTSRHEAWSSLNALSPGKLGTMFRSM
jgi:hypothetical protein